jgi:hypothetical protein
MRQGQAPIGRTRAEQRIVDSMYRELTSVALEKQLGRPPTAAEISKYKPRGGWFSSHIAAIELVKRRIKEFGEDATELVALYGARTRSGEYDPLAALSILAFEVVRRDLEIPDGAWAYALWAYKLEGGPVKTSAEYWLTRWKDGEDLPDSAEGAKMMEASRKMLDILMRDSDDELAVEEISI